MPTIIEQTLLTVVAQAEQLLPRFPVHPDEQLDQAGLMAKDFRSTARTSIEQIKSLSDQVDGDNARVAALESRFWLVRWLKRDELEALRTTRDKNSRSLKLQIKRLELQERQHSADATVIARVQARYNQLMGDQAIRTNLEEIRQLAESIHAQIQRWKTRYGMLRPVLETHHEVPDLKGISNLDDVTRSLQVLEAMLVSRVQTYSQGLDAGNQAQLVLDDLAEHTLVDYASAPTEFVKKTINQLRHFLSFAAPNLSFEQLLDELTQPTAYKYQETWLAFWTATAATVRYSTQAHGAGASEGARTGFWCAEWRSQMSHWSPDALQAVGLGKDAVSTLVFHLEDSGAETKTGEDVLIMYDVATRARRYCSVAGIQFKQSDAGDQSISLAQSDGRQRDTIVDLHRKSNGRWPGIYALLRPVAAGLASVPAVKIDSVIAQFRDILLADGSSATKAPSTISWAKHGQSLPTVLAHCLTEHRGQSFGSLADAFDWIEGQVDIDLPKYLIVQSVGDRPYSLEYAIDRAQRLGLAKGRHYKMLEHLQVREPKRTRSKDNDVGHSR